MRLAKSGPDGRSANPEARVGESPQAQSNDQHQHRTVAIDVTTPPAIAVQPRNQIAHDASMRQSGDFGSGQPTPSDIMKSQMDTAHAMDFGVKFIGGLDAMPGTLKRVPPTATAATSDPSQPHGQQNQVPPAALQRKPVGPSSYPEKPREGEKTGRQGDHDETECHPFWLSWRDIFLGIWLIVTGLLKIPLVIGDGMGKALHHTPRLYGDKTVRKWPQVTGFPHGCVAGCLGLWYGLYDGLTDWITLPYKAVRDGEGARGCLKVSLQGIANVVFKLSAGCFAILFHPIFGIYKEFCKIKVVVKHERSSRVSDTPPV
ncbi:hypothetical protein PG996_006793 [Apiospora saccharicola]|uniref:Uncharacterized protein n=1 Tax=Apiospora saccharicola TaxID=335842 RepID=A0ABR1V916_9PEZI